MPGTARGRDPVDEEQFLGSLYKGGELLAAGKIVEAREHLEKAHELQPQNEKAQNLLGLAYFKLGLFDQAASVYELLVRENPADPTLRVNIGLVYLKSNNLERAIKEFETATDLEPGHKKAHNYLGLALAQGGDYARAREHFHAAGSEQMAEKMERALGSRAAPSSIVIGTASSIVASSSPTFAPIDPAPPPLPEPAPAPSRATPQVVAVAAAQPLPPPEEPPIEVMSDDEPGEEVQRDAEVVVVETASLNADWGSQLPAPPAPAPAPVEEELPVLDAVVAQESESPGWLSEPQEAPQPAATSMWVTEHVADVPMEVPVAPTSETWEEGAAVTAPVESVWAAQEAPAEEFASPPSEPQQYTESVVVDQRYSVEINQQYQQAQLEPHYAAASPEVAQHYAEQYGEVAEQYAHAQQYVEDVDAQQYVQPPDAEQYAAPPLEPEVPDLYSSVPAPTAEHAAAQLEQVDDPYADQPTRPIKFKLLHNAPELENSFAEVTIAANPVQASFESVIARPEPVAPFEAQPVEEPAFAAQANEETYAQVAAPAVEAGYVAMVPQRLGDLGALNEWVQEPSAGPFQLGPSGLAVTVAGEMLSRMSGLVAVVGSVQVNPEHRRKRGRPTNESFGTPPAQMQRIAGNGVLYLESGAGRFNVIDLTDQPGVSVDDDGAYLREELVFAFEEVLSFENGRVADGGVSIDLVHLKGHGRVLLALPGSLKAMPVPAGAPMVVPLGRLVGWFGRIAPRIIAFGGQGAVELTGDGFALLGTPT